ncbi:hypothetical protein [Brevibacillus laterosporus]|uniref:hypothetical protein n=1 Tax=Brevibacillus laterosporus TaxID=1465 RepID=UPI003D23CD15
MPLVPMRNKITVYPALLDDEGNPKTDEWDRPVYGDPFSLRCRIQEKTKLVRAQTNQGGVHGVTSQEVVSSAQVLCDKLAPISISDRVEFTDELGRVRQYSPLAIEIRRNISGKPNLTEVAM